MGLFGSMVVVNKLLILGMKTWDGSGK